MTGPEHFKEAERMAGHCALQVSEADIEGDVVSDITRAYIALAQVHATLAAAAATARAFDPEDFEAWREAVGVNAKVLIPADSYELIESAVLRPEVPG